MDSGEGVDMEVRDSQIEAVSAESVSDLASDSEKSSKNRKIKYIILSIAVLVLILSVAAVVFIIVNKSQKDGSQNVDGQEFVSEFDAKVTEIHETIWQKFQEDGNVDGLVANYRTTIDEAKNNGNYYLANAAINNRSFDLIYINYCERAIETLKNEDVSMFLLSDLAIFYNNAAGISLECNDLVNYEAWSNAYNDVMVEVKKNNSVESAE